MSLQEIIDALEKATGADRALDCHLWVLSKGGDARMQYVDGDAKEFVWERGVDGMWIRDIQCFQGVPKYTASVDAATALCARAVPAANCWGIDKSPSGFSAFISRNEVKTGHWLIEAEHKASAAMALCLAILSALRAKLEEPTA
jgi:hypothetical protein